VENDARILISF